MRDTVPGRPLCPQSFQQPSNKSGKTREHRIRAANRERLAVQGLAGTEGNEWVPDKTDVIFLVRMRSAVQIRPAAPKILENFGFRGFFVVKSRFAVWSKNSDPHRDPHAETAGKDKRVPDGKI